MTTTPKLWKSQTQVNTSDGGVSQLDGQIVGLPDGGYVVVWRDLSLAHNPGGIAIVGQKYNVLGEMVGGEVKISTGFVDGDQTAPAITAMPDGGIAVAFVDSDPGDNIHVRRFDANLNLLRSDTIDTTGNTTIQPAITFLANGGYVVSYTVGSGTDTDIVARIVSPTGVVGAQFDIDNQTDNRNFSELATLSNGNFVAVYQDEFGGSVTDIDIRFRIMTAAGAQVIGPSFVLGASGGTAETDPDVAALTGGGFVVVWTDGAGDADGNGVRATIFNNAGTVVSSDIAVNTSQTGNQDEASVIGLADGGFLVSWEDHPADLVRAQRFDAAGNTIGTEFTVKAGVGLVNSPEAALLADGRFAYALGHFVAGDLDVMTSIWDPYGPRQNDFYKDVSGDILWRNNDGTVGLWDIKGGQVAAMATVASPAVAPTDWHVDDVADFSGDGKADILWRNDNGTVAIWQMDGTQIAAGVVVANPDVAPTSWHIQATADFGGDGKDDILWRNNDGTVAIWQMNGTQIAATAVIATPVQTPNDWHIQGTGDFNGDGKDDILWRNNDGTVAAWQMNGMQIAATAIVAGPAFAPTDWHVQGVGDFNGDGKDDILLRHNDGTVGIWLMNGTQIAASAIIATPAQAPNDWHIEDVLDVNGDGKSDILWRNDNGSVATWQMNGLQMGPTAIIANGAAAPSDWHIAHHHYDVV
jgi:WD40 repeat protein